MDVVAPLFLAIVGCGAVTLALLAAGWIVGPRREGAVKRMPYESGMDPIHDTRRRFDVRFHLVAIAFLVFDVELLFLYPWAVAARPAPQGEPARGVDVAVNTGLIESRDLVFWGVMIFFALLALGLAYDWRKGVLRWR